jgi:CDP-diacylglycerol--glycerol-3-phosphate 3-phosphatidyltransferase
VVFALTAFRAALAPVLLLLADRRAPGWSFVLCLTAAFLSDVYDGVIARRYGVATPGLRRFDSIADTLFYLTVIGVAWWLYPEAMHRMIVGIALVVALEVLRYLFDLTKFGRETSYHMWSAKAWGISLFAAFVAILGFSNPKLLPIAVILGIITDLEGFLASVLLLEWAHDVPSVWHAWKLRQQQLKRRQEPGLEKVARSQSLK